MAKNKGNEVKTEKSDQSPVNGSDNHQRKQCIIQPICIQDVYKRQVLQTFEPQVRNQIDVLDTEEWNAIHSGRCV